MSRDWKPGDVAVITSGGNKGRVGLISATVGEETYLPVALPDGEEEGGVAVLAYGQRSVRPLVAIDPDDQQDRARFHQMAINYIRGDWTAQESMRGLSTPPKPDEPTGLGAVVEDADGGVWIRAARIAHAWHHPMGKWAEYRDIPAVRVHSEGVTP